MTCPTELIKIRQQSTLGPEVATIWNIAGNIYKEKGIRGLYRGYVSTATRELAYGAYFLTVSIRSFVHQRPLTYSI